MTERLYINGTKVHDVDAAVVSPGGNGTISAVEIDFGTPDRETFLDPRPLADGMVLRGSVAMARSPVLKLRVDGVASRGEGFDEWESLVGIINADNGLVSLKTERPDSAAATVSRELLVVTTGEPGLVYRDAGGGDGLRQSGSLEITIPFVAPFPWWRDTTAQETVLSFSAGGSDSAVVSRGGQKPCGLEAKVTTTGSLASLSLGDGNRTLVMNATFGGSALGVDWFHEDPEATAVDAGVTLSIPSHVFMHSDSTTLTVTTSDGGASGDHTITVKHYPLWKAP